MTPPGLQRRAFLSAAGALTASVVLARQTGAADLDPAKLGFTPDPAWLAKATVLLARTGAADLHAHPGGIFSLRPGLQSDPAPQDRVIADMRAGFVNVASFAAIADRLTLALTPNGIAVGRDFKPGEAFQDYLHQTADLDAVAAARGIKLLRSPKDLRALVPGRDVGGFLTVEGGDFLNEDVSRLAGAFERGVRCITLIHYRPNALGDNQTSAPTRGGLTPFGGQVVTEMNRLGIMIDVAHAAETTVRQVLERSSVPIMCSHTILKSADFDHPRFLTAETARLVAAAGGVVGAWPSGVGATTMSQFVDRIFRLTEVVGPDHAALGTDMDGNYRPVLDNYRQVPLLVSELLRRGYGEANTGKFIAGNFRHLWGQVARA